MRAPKEKFAIPCFKLGVKSILRTAPAQDGSPHVEKSGDTFHRVITDRGSEFERRTTASRNEAGSSLISGESFAISIEYALNNRVDGQGFRSVMYEKTIELMDAISREWGDRQKEEIENILEKIP